MFQFARHGDKISEKKEQNVRMEKKQQKKTHALYFVIIVVFLGGSCLCVFFFPRRFSRAGENHAVFLHPLQSVLFQITLRGEVILKSNVKLASVPCIYDKSLMDRPGCFIQFRFILYQVSAGACTQSACSDVFRGLLVLYFQSSNKLFEILGGTQDTLEKL